MKSYDQVSKLFANDILAFFAANAYPRFWCEDLHGAKEIVSASVV